MQTQAIQAVFENGIFRPLRPVELPEHQQVTLLVQAEEDALAEEVGYEPLPLLQRRTIRVRVKPRSAESRFARSGGAANVYK